MLRVLYTLQFFPRYRWGKEILSNLLWHHDFLTGPVPILNSTWKPLLLFFFCTASTKLPWYFPWTWVCTVLNSMETVLITAEVLGLIINNLCYQTRMVYTVSKQGSQGLGHEGFSESYFPKLYIHRLPHHILMKVLFLPPSRISETLRRGKKLHGHYSPSDFTLSFFVRLWKILFFK